MRIAVMLRTMTDADLYRRGAETLVASWEAIAPGARGAAVIRADGVTAAVFPCEPHRGIYNNALLERGLPADRRAAALDAMEAAYASAGVNHFAAWVHESDDALRADVAARGYAIDTTTRAMGMALADLKAPRPEIELAPADWAQYDRYLRRWGVSAGLFAGVEHERFRLLIAQQEGEPVATALAFDHGDDRGIYNVSTVEGARRRGLGTALTAVLLHDAAARGCRTATLQSTAIAQGVYANLGFRDLGRFDEYTRV
jgi:ribosomal protein S18 acetylase RimI-like enzyme